MSTIATEILETTAAALETTAAALETTLAATEPVAEAALDIASIKKLMDGFHPEELLPDLSQLFGSLSALCRVAVMIGPVVLLLLGLAYLFLSPKEANYYFGYRCYFGMGSIHAWRFTQHLAGMLFTAGGVILSIVMYTLSAGFAEMEVTDMVWKAANYLFWQAIIALVMTLLINFAAFFFFDRNGAPRKRKKSRRKNAGEGH